MGLMITDERLRLSVERFFEKLEKFFPEHKVFALDSIDKDLREKLSELYKKTGCATAEEFLGAYGFQIISGDEVRKLRSFVLYTPGNEPDVIKGKVENMLRRLQEYYPDRKIPGGLQNEHKNLSKSVSGLYQWLGYESSREMLAAYGFDVQHSDGGRPTNDYQQLITFLQEKYSGDNKAKSMGILVHDNPEYAGQIKTLQNRANELFGMSLSNYLKEIGVIGVASTAKVEKKKLCNYFMVAVEGQTAPLPCATDTRTIHEGDFIEMCRVSDQTKLIGQVTQTYYFVPEEDLPCPVEQMRQFVRKVTKAELREREASKEKYIFCSVRLRDRHDSLYYLSPFEDIEAGDLVSVPHSWYGLTDGVVVEVRRASEKTAPYSVKKTKKIERIIKRVREESRKAAEAIDKLVQEHGTKPYTSQQIDHTAQTKFEQCTYFSSAIFRGLEKEIRAALRIIHPAAFDVMTYHKQLLEGVGQFECPSPFVPIILENYPNLKGVFFAESWKEKSVYLAYSDSGCSTVSTMRPIGECNFYTRDRWTLAHDPTEESFTFQGGRYVFEEKSQWEKCDFVLDDTKTQLAGQIVIPSDPYRKRLTTEPCQIIKICYPDEETFYTPAPQETKPKVDKPVSENVANLSGKAFVVTGDLYHYDSRDDLKAIIEQAGGKMTGSVSSKTTALITNFPDSGTTKIRKAKECGIEIISEDEFIQRYMSNASAPSDDDQADIPHSAENVENNSEVFKKTLIFDQGHVRVRMHIIAPKSVTTEQMKWKPLDQLLQETLLNPEGLAVAVAYVVTALNNDCFVISDYACMVTDDFCLTAGWMYNRKCLFDDFPMGGNSDDIYPTDIDIEDANTWVNEFIRQRLCAETGEVYFPPLLEAAYLRDVFSEEDRLRYDEYMSTQVLIQFDEDDSEDSDELDDLIRDNPWFFGEEETQTYFETEEQQLHKAEALKCSEEEEHKRKEEERQAKLAVARKRLEEARRIRKEAEELNLHEAEERKCKEAEELKRREDEKRERNLAAAYQRLEAEKQRRKEAEEEKLLAEEERRRKAAEEQQHREAEERKRREAAERERLAEEERERKEAEEWKRREDEERQRKEAEEHRRQEEALAQARIAEQVHKAAEEERKRRELRAAEAARKAAEEQHRKEEAKKLSPEEKFEMEMEAWNAKAVPILRRREEARQLLIRQSRPQKLAEIEQKRNAQIADETRKKETLTAERINSEQKLSTLGFLQFSEKKRTKSRIEQLTADISACDERMRTAEETYRKDLDQLDKWVAKEVDRHALELKMKYPLPRKPRKTSPQMSPAQLADAALKMAILETVASHGILSFAEIMDKCYALAGLNVPKVRPLVESLVREGELIETTKQKNHEIHHYFEIAY